jgi:hypothetical protein
MGVCRCAVAALSLRCRCAVAALLLRCRCAVERNPNPLSLLRFGANRGFNFSAFCKQLGFISQRTRPTGPLALQVNEARKPMKRHKQRRATSREGARTPHGPALSPVISGLGRSPSTRPGGHHAGPSPSHPRRRCSLLPTTKPRPRPPTRGHSAGPRTSRLRCLAAMRGAESREQTTSPCTAAAVEIPTPLKHRTRPSGTASREQRAAATSSKASRKTSTHRDCGCGVVNARLNSTQYHNNNSTAGHIGARLAVALKTCGAARRLR